MTGNNEGTLATHRQRAHSRIPVLALSALAVILAWDAYPAGAYPLHARLARVAYNKPVRCELCHANAGGSQRNPYGTAWARQGAALASFPRVAALDSDEDGVPNGEELAAGSNPGDPRSTPADPGRYARVPPQPFIPREQVLLVLPDAEQLEVVEPDLAADQLQTLGTVLGRPLTDADRLPTLYLASHAGKRTGVALFAHFREKKLAYSLLVGAGADGRVARVAVLDAGGDEGTAFQPYLQCLAGRARTEMPAPGEAGCPTVRGQEAAARAMGTAVRDALALVSVVFQRRPVTP